MAAKKQTEPENNMETKQTEQENVTASAKERVMYVGPTVPGIGIQNRVYTEIPTDARDVIKENPQIGNLFIRIRDYPTANRMIREKKGYIYNAFLRAEEIMVENAEKTMKHDTEDTEERG